ncbi:MAG: 2-succinylbenzoate--CoA ligase [Hydrococcus sp. Prado102]|jgi:O-succinylbenzoic acid--CoA ligase|nr:2-succinylbenzoate--CoA ligase [Hydrococcus sp. Prado102]
MSEFPNPDEILAYLKKASNEDMLIDYDRDRFYLLVRKIVAKLTRLKVTNPTPTILIAETEPFKFLAAFLASVATNCHLFVANPHWKEQEWQQVYNLVKPDLVISNPLLVKQYSSSISERNKIINEEEPKIMIATGGSSGNIRFAIHTWETLTASVKGFIQYFKVKKINSFCILPIYHVSGLMQFLRSFLTGGKFLLIPYNTLKIKGEININPQDFFISLVPTQLQFFVQTYPKWLSRFYTVLLGGAPAWPALIENARNYGIKLAPTYGMTETASQVVTLKCEDFLNNNSSSGRVLPHAKVTIRSDTGELLETGKSGLITIEADSLFWGYYPECKRRESFQTDDIGYFDAQGYLHIIGRNSQKIITGGENVFPAEVEAAILGTQLVTDVAVIGLPDEKWGQVITAIYVPKQKEISVNAIALAIKDKISRYKQPKHWLPVESLPRNQQGKVNYKNLQEIAEYFINP